MIHDLGYMPTKADPDVWTNPVVKPDSSTYYDIVLCYVDDVLAISYDKMNTIDGIKSVFKLKVDKADIPNMYLGSTIQTTETADGTNFWTISSEKYVKAAV